MNNNKQSSVDFIHDSLIKYIGFEDIESTKIFDKIFEQAKAMHKEEIEDAWDKGDYCIDLPDGTWEQKYKSAEQYYNETFGGNNEQTK